MQVKDCRVCDGGLDYVLSLGDQYVADFRHEKGGLQVPLDLARCDDCGLVQLRDNAPAESMWNDHYGYKSGINRLIREDLRDIVTNVRSIVSLNEESYVVDIGANDGTLLGYHTVPKTQRVGFEPSQNVFDEASDKGFTMFNDFFSAQPFLEYSQGKKADAITAISMFYDLDNPNRFLRDIKQSLSKKGVLVIQQNYLKSMLEQNAFDNICHEHRCYYSFHSLEGLLNRNGLATFDVSFNDINGGSIRTYITHQGARRKSPRVEEAMQRDIQAGLNTLRPYEEFAQRAEFLKRISVDFLQQQKERGRKVYGLGASTRGSTTLQYFGITPELIPFIGDANPEKWGKLMAGSWIPIVSPEQVAEDNPDYQYVLIWHLFNAIREKGKFILPLPKFREVEIR